MPKPNPDISELYSEGTWKGRPNYECALCPFSSLHEEVIREHVVKRHTTPPAQPRVAPGLVDRFGNPIEVNPEEKEEIEDGEKRSDETDG
jgi:hypothetical protein